jgi:putative FmdB family regulatory protein
MPTYEFRCPRGHEFEKLYRTISGAEVQARCPECGEPAERVMSATGFAFKGSGFYLTDYGKNAHRGEAPASAARSDAGSGESSASAQATNEPKAKSETAPAAGASSGGAAESKKAEPKPQPKADPKPASSPAKKSSAE